MNGESLHEYRERFNKLCASCPHHQISEQLLIQYFYDGLMPMERSMIDASSGGALVDKTPQQARVLMSNMSANYQQFSTRANLPVRKVNKVSTSSTLEQQIANLTSVVQQLAIGGIQQALKYEISSMTGHSTDACPSLHEDGSYKKANAMGGFQGQQGFQRKYDPCTNTYNIGWKDHPNFNYLGNQQPVVPNTNLSHPPGFFQPRP